MSEADRLAAALKQEQWAHTETAKRGTSYMVAAFDAEQARRIRAEERVAELEARWERDNTCGICPYRESIQARVAELEAALRKIADYNTTDCSMAAYNGAVYEARLALKGDEAK